MESPIIVDKPPEYHGNDDRGFPFEEEESAGAWSELAARHPDIAARLRAHPAAPAAGAAWARKRRPDTHDHDFGDSFGDFDRFIPSEFREHFPSSFGSRRFGRGQEEPQAHTSQPQSPPRQQTTATQTERDPPPEQTLPQYGLRNTVDLGQKSAADPSLVDADERTQRSVSAPPESRPQHSKMSASNHQEPEQPARPGKVRNIPIFVEGRDAPVINDTLDHGSHFGETKPTYVPQQSPPDGAYFPDETPLHFNHPPPNFTRSFATPFTKQYRQGQPFAQQKVYPQSAAAFARAASPHRSQSPKPQHDEFVNVPVHHEKPQPKPEPPRPQQRQPPPPQQRQQPPPPPPQPQQQPPPKQPTPPPQPKPHDPISQILEIQTNVLNLMSEVEKFTGTKKDKQYLFLDEMLTRNLISLDNIETEGKENIRNARKEAIRCIQKCIAVLEAKADGRSVSTPQPQEPAQDVEMNAEGQTEGHANEEKATENGEVEMKEGAKEEPKVDTEQPKEENKEPPAQPENIEAPQTDTRPEEPAPVPETKEEDKDKSKKPTKKRDKSKDKSTDAKNEAMAVDEKESKMEVDAGASQ